MLEVATLSGRYFPKANLDFRILLEPSKFSRTISSLRKGSVIKDKVRARILDNIGASPEVCGVAAPSLGAASQGLCSLFSWSQKNDIWCERHFCPWMATMQEKLCSINARRP